MIDSVWSDLLQFLLHALVLFLPLFCAQRWRTDLQEPVGLTRLNAEDLVGLHAADAKLCPSLFRLNSRGASGTRCKSFTTEDLQRGQTSLSSWFTSLASSMDSRKGSFISVRSSIQSSPAKVLSFSVSSREPTFSQNFWSSTRICWILDRYVWTSSRWVTQGIRLEK